MVYGSLAFGLGLRSQLHKVCTKSVVLSQRPDLLRPYTIDRRWYSDAVHDHFSKPRNVGSLNTKDPNVGTAIVGKASCGDVIKLQIKIEDNIIQDVKFKTFGCGSAIASTSLASELIKGKTCDDALKIKNVDIAEHLNLPPVKIHCSLLAEDAVKHAIKDYRKKQANSQLPETREAILE